MLQKWESVQKVAKLPLKPGLLGHQTSTISDRYVANASLPNPTLTAAERPHGACVSSDRRRNERETCSRALWRRRLPGPAARESSPPPSATRATGRESLAGAGLRPR